MNVNQPSVMRVLRAALFGFVLFLVGYMIPHPGALATPGPKATGDSVPGGFHRRAIVDATRIDFAQSVVEESLAFRGRLRGWSGWPIQSLTKRQPVHAAEQDGNRSPSDCD